jgi:hypothetical protein
MDEACKVNIDSIIKLHENLAILHKKYVKFGIFGSNANRPASDNSRINIGQQAVIMEEGRTIRYPNGARIRLENRSGEIRYLIIRPGGTITIPSRPFWTRSIKNIEKGIRKLLQTQFKLLVINKNSTENILKQIGIFCKEEVKSSITNESYEPLSELQIWKKGNSKELIDTSNMLNAVDYKIN